MIYRHVIRPLLFRCDAEWMHDQSIAWSATAQRIPGALAFASRFNRSSDPRLETTLAGIPLANPIGLAAGYDKSGKAVDALAALGFGHIEIGSISADPSAGNPRPRLWRLPDDEAICVHYGLPNDGAVAVSERLRRQRLQVPLGINVVNTNRVQQGCVESKDQILEDYWRTATTLREYASYFMMNLSCPNTSDGREFFGDPVVLRELLQGLSDAVGGTPVLLKISPDFEEASIDRLIETVQPYSIVRGFMFNLSPGRRTGLETAREKWRHLPGAISGSPVQAWMDAKIACLYSKIDRGRFQIVGAGGVRTAEDVYRKICSGASVVQLYTSLVYQGPGIVRRINRDLLSLFEKNGIQKISDLVGVGTD